MTDGAARRLAAVATVLALVLAGCPASPASPAPCPRGAATVVVDTRERRLSLCEASGRLAMVFPVALGAGGRGKRRQGDRKTPLGRYALGAPRPSRRFGLFIPVAYPTPEQRRQGFTGGAVGIHGPARAFVGAGALNTAVDWTDGCIALASDAAIARVAAWTRSARARAIELR